MGLSNFRIDFDNHDYIDVQLDTPLNTNQTPTLANETLHKTNDELQMELDRMLDAIYDRNWPETNVSYYDVCGYLANEIIHYPVVFERPQVRIHDYVDGNLKSDTYFDLPKLHIDMYVQYQYLVQQARHEEAADIIEALSYIKRLSDIILFRTSYDINFGGDFVQLTDQQIENDFNYDIKGGDILLGDPTLGISLGLRTIDYRRNLGSVGIVTPMTYRNNNLTLYCGPDMSHDEVMKRVKLPHQYRKWGTGVNDLSYGYIKVGKWTGNVRQPYGGIKNYAIT